MESYIPIIKLIIIFILFIVVIILVRKNKIINNKFLDCEQRSLSHEQRSLDYEQRFSSIISVEYEIQKALKAKDLQLNDIENKITDALTKEEEKTIKLTDYKNKIKSDITYIQDSYKHKKLIYDTLLSEIAIYDDEIELIELGFYKPQYHFDTSEEFKEKLTQIKTEQKSLVSNKTAITCFTEWTVEGSKAKGRVMTNRSIKLTARAFNNECEATISKVNWNNAERMVERIKKAFHALNKLNESNNIFISGQYMALKLDELRLTYEYKEKKQQEKEEQNEIKRQMREEAKLEQETDKALKEEQKYQKLLDKAKDDANKSAGDKLIALQEKIATLGIELEEAHAKSERAKSMAQQTKIGHVYVISNQGSFGENIYKIGMTRRLEPIDRVKELGDASVPFIFDVHAMIYSDDAPALENTLHKNFDFNRVNLVNTRKEFFNVTLDEIEKQVKKISPNAVFTVTAEARQYRESQSIRSQRSKTDKTQSNVALPESI